MKKILVMLALISFSCNNQAETESAAPNTVNVDNVEGGIPDTARGGTLNQPMEIDSTTADSLRR